MVFSLTWLRETLLNAGLKVAEQPGWINRGHADMGDVKGVMCHHTAGPPTGNMPSLGVVTKGRSDLAGPLAQLCLGRDGTYFVVAAGLCYHAGKGMWRGLTTGNSSFIGIEAENTGGSNDLPWPEAQMAAYRRGVAAILKKIGADAGMCCGHKEYALPPGRKDDPTFDMEQFRRAVAEIMAGGAAPQLIPASDGRPTLRRGDQGDAVKQLQQLLGVPTDGKFGVQTEVAVRKFQLSKTAVPDGIVGPKTWELLRNSAAPSAVSS